MARHRNIRSMNYSDEYDGYDDVYGHSVEDDLCMSPSDAAFIYDREGTRNQQQIGQFFKDISEEDESELVAEYDLSDDDKQKLEACLRELKETLENTVTRKEMAQTLLDNNFNVEKALNILLDKGPLIQVKPSERKEKDDNLKLRKPTKNFNIPKLSKFNTKLISNFNKPAPNLNFPNLSPLHIPFVVNKSDTESKGFSSLTDLSNNHLQKVNNLFALTDQREVNSTAIITRNFSDLNISNKKTDFNEEPESIIDLSLAIKSSGSSIRNKTLSNSIEDFEMPYVECDSSEMCGTTYGCMMDISFIVNKRFTNAKKSSVFGMVLCKRFIKKIPVIKSESNNTKVDIFNFNTPSPDDSISQYLKR